MTSGQTAGQGLPQIRLEGGGHKPNTAGVSRTDVHGVTCVGGAYVQPT